MNNKVKKGFTFITETGDLLIVTKVFKNGKNYAIEFGGEGVEEVIYDFDEEDELIGEDSNITYGIIDNTGKIIKDQTSFYFKKEFAEGVASELNNHMSDTLKPFKVKKYYLIDSKQVN